MKRLLITCDKISAIILFLIIFSVSISCNDSNDPEIFPEAENPREQLTDYSDSNNWAVITTNTDKPVDVFFFYPTTYSGSDTSAVVTDEGMRSGAITCIDKQTSVYTGTANLFMPFYRQMNATFTLNLSLNEQDEFMRKYPVADAIAAFEYYLANHNNGRPVIIAGHSQGSNVSLYLMEYLKDKQDVLKRIVATYAIGYSVTQEYLANNPHLSFAESKDDTGVIISWNTEATGSTGKNLVILEGAVCINPINWKRDDTYAGKEESLGSRLMGENGFEKFDHFADAQISFERFAIHCSSELPKTESIIPFIGEGNYHGQDYGLYYYDLQQNVKDRVDAYLEKK